METKYCKKCDRDLPFDSFAKNIAKKDGLQGQCRECKKSTDAKHYQENKEAQLVRVKKHLGKTKKMLAEHKSELGCKYCNEYDECCLDFHHTDDNKEFTISQAIHRFCWDRLLAEVEKCEVVCASCHRKLHAKRKLKARR